MRGRGLVQRVDNGVHHVVRIRERIVVPEPEQPKAECLECLRAAPVITALLSVLTAVQFDDQPMFDTTKISDVAVEWMLPPKFHARLRGTQA